MIHPTDDKLEAMAVRLSVKNGYVAPDFATPVADPLRLEAAAMLRACQGGAEPDARQEGWQPIETAPKDGTWIRVRLPGAKPEDYRVRYAPRPGAFGLSEWQVNEATYLTPWSRPTHWMPLLVAPALAEKGPTP